MAEGHANRKLSAILSADVKEYSRLMSQDERGTIRTLTAYKEAMSMLIQEYKGRVVDSPGDNLLSEFSSVVDAVNCAVEIQRELAERNADLSPARQMAFRIGINLGDVVEEEGRIYGDGVNIAARIEGLAEGGGICISGTAYDQVVNKLGLEYEFLGEKEVKNIEQPVRVYRVLSFPGAAAHRVVKAKEALGKKWRNIALVVAAILVVGGTAVAVRTYILHPSQPPMEVASVEKMAFPLPDKPSIAVLPFVDMSEEPDQEYFSDGLTEEIISALSRVPKLFVIARNSTFTYKGKPVKVQQVSEELGVRYVLEGSVRKAGDRVRITAQLIDATTGHHLWSERYDRPMKDIFALQDEITKKVIIAMQVKLTHGESRRLTGRGTDNLEAYLKFVKGMQHYERHTPDDYRLAREFFKEAIALDPAYATPYAFIGITQWQEVMRGRSKSPQKSIAEAFELAQKAIALDESEPYGHVLLSRIYTHKGRYEKAMAAAKRAVSLNPSGIGSNMEFGRALIRAGRPEEAIPYFKRGIRATPFNPSVNLWGLSTAYWVMGRYEEALTASKKAVQIGPKIFPRHLLLTACYAALGREEEAHAAAAEVLRLSPKFSLQGGAKSGSYFMNQAQHERFIDALRKAGLPETPPLPLPNKPSIAVLPFTNLSGDPKQEYFSDGITEDIITALSKVPKLFIIARNSTFTYKGKPVKVQQVGRDLGVRYVLEGSIQKDKDRVRITAQLVDATTGHHLWADRYDRELKDIFALQDEITMKIITATRVQLMEGEHARASSKGTENLEAYLKLLQGRELNWRLNKDDNALGRQILEEAIALDPNYANAYIWLAATHMLDVWLQTSKSPKQSFSKAIELAQKALSIDDSLSNAHSLLGLLYAMTGQYEKAIAEGERAIELGPNDVAAHRRLGVALSTVGRYKEAITLYEKSIRLNPFPRSATLFNLGIANLFAGRCEEAITACMKAVRGRPDDLLAHIYLTAAYSSCGREAEAHATAAEVLRIDPQFSVEYHARQLKYKNEDKERFIDGLRKAGLK